MTMQVKRDAEIGRQVNEIRNEQQRKRKERREKGEASVGDTVSGWLGW